MSSTPSGAGPDDPAAAQARLDRADSPETEGGPGTLSRILSSLAHPKDEEIDRLVADLRHLSKVERARLADELQRVLRDGGDDGAGPVESPRRVFSAADTGLGAMPGWRGAGARLRGANRAIDAAVVIAAVAISISVIVFGLQVDLMKPAGPRSADGGAAAPPGTSAAPAPAKASSQPTAAAPVATADQAVLAGQLQRIEPAAGGGDTATRTAAIESGTVPSPTDALAGGNAATARPAAAVPMAPQEVEFLMQRGDEFLRSGDIVSARVFYERAAQSGYPAAATGVGKTYDPLFLSSAGVVGVRGDPAQAALWYRRASDAGDQVAAQRLRALSPQLLK